ncbi:Fe(3+) dicitrate ABC transporter substrate-binding protein [Marinomonas spartinae]|uniref:Fe(3+) dicitrate ABC transporter substrate-binding protein n=1 Tax=Marinomonas spartinae TaxID=1792290 RepID=UPI0018F1A8DC|nr:Fe(3+) dicitrate ABC transporter substrate-binding protein [Marinomonas spartinae]MBJ7553989.1 ABC transporter substrate-binding protein [Marinomonas spartinae]
MLFRRCLSFFTLLSIGFALPVWAERSVQDERGTFTIQGTPKRIVVLEFSFVDALVNVGLSPVGIADDNHPDDLLPRVRNHLKPWVSLGMRSQPSLEEIAALKPDLIIADSERHASIYDSLSNIAPTLLLKSRGESYQENLESAEKIGIVVNKRQEMQQSLRKHEALMETYRETFKKMGTIGTVQFAIASSRGVWLHGPTSYAGGVLKKLGITSAIDDETRSPYLPASLELLLKINPEWLLVGAYGDHTVLDDWRSQPLYALLKAVKHHHVIAVSPQIWSLNRGIFAAESIAQNLQEILQNNH